MRTRRAAGADAGADRVDVVVVRPDRDLRAVAGLAGAGLDLDDAVGDLGHLELEQPLDEAGVGARHDDLRALGGLADLDDVRLQPAPWLVALVRHLLGLRQQRLDPAEVEQRVAGVGLLDDAGDDVALAAGVLLVLHLALGLADALQITCLAVCAAMRPKSSGVSSHSRDDVAVLVELLRDHADLAGLDVDLDQRLLGRVGHALVRGDERVRERLEHDLDRDALLALDVLERLHHLGIHRRTGSLREVVSLGAALFGLRAGLRLRLRAAGPTRTPCAPA